MESDLEHGLIFRAANIPPGECITTTNGEVSIFTTPSPEKNGANEDAAAIIQVNRHSLVLVVADGVGGQPAGAQASGILVEAIRDSCTRSVSDSIELRDALLSGIEQANQKIIESCNGSATTLAAVEINNDYIRTYHVGDSFIMLVGQRGKLKLETVLHSPTGYAVESGILSEDDAIYHEERHIVSNVVGTKNMHLSMGMPLHMNRFDTLLIASDGLIDNLEKDLIIETIRKGPLGACSNKLYQLASARMANPGELYKPDDLSCILFRPGK